MLTPRMPLLALQTECFAEAKAVEGKAEARDKAVAKSEEQSEDTKLQQALAAAAAARYQDNHISGRCYVLGSSYLQCAVCSCVAQSTQAGKGEAVQGSGRPKKSQGKAAGVVHWCMRRCDRQRDRRSGGGSH